MTPGGRNLTCVEAEMSKLAKSTMRLGSNCPDEDEQEDRPSEGLNVTLAMVMLQSAQ